MTLEEYNNEIEKLEAGQVPDTLTALGYDCSQAADFLGREIQGCAWQTWTRKEAMKLVVRCFAISRRFDK